MEQHLLLTVGDDLTSLCEADFINSFFKNQKDIWVTIFSVHSPELSYPSTCKKGCSTESSSVHDERLAALDLSRTALLRHGVREDHINAKVVQENHGTVEDIIQEAKSGRYDAVILGRHRYELFEQFYSLSTTREILSQRIAVPFWICGNPEFGRRNVLLCVDGSEAGMRAADHVGSILRDEIEHTVTVFHVDNAGDGKSVDILKRVEQRLGDKGVSKDRIDNKIVYSSRVTKAIVEEAVRGAYAAVAVGHHTFRPHGFKEWLIGSRCLKLLEAVDKCALWVSQ
jgi:nucleotide-binding universal stress UspA family protein